MTSPVLDIQLLPERTRSELTSATVLTFAVGRGPTTSLACDTPVLVVPMRGSLRISGRYRDVTLRPGSALVTDGPVEVRSMARNALWVVASASDRQWRGILVPLLPAGIRPALVGGLQPEPNALRRQMLRLLRRRLCPARGMEAPMLQEERFFLALADCIRRQHDVIGRCPGRTHSQRAKVHARLQNARLYMLEQCDGDIGIADIAGIAGYSSSHFMRTFHTAFGETAYTFLTRARLARARALLTTSTMAVAEVAFAAGFDDRGTFSRQFRRHFGMTAADLRRRHARLVQNGLSAHRTRERVHSFSATASVSPCHSAVQTRA